MTITTIPQIKTVDTLVEWMATLDAEQRQLITIKSSDMEICYYYNKQLILRLVQASLFPASALAPTGATIIGKYRYNLWRIWDESLPRACFVMLNPSTADATHNDPTLSRCINFAKRWGYGSLEVVNLYAYRTSSPAMLAQYAVSNDAVGPENDEYIKNAVARSRLIVAAWGAHKMVQSRVREVSLLLKGRRLMCLELTKHGYPMHPLYAPGDCVLREL